MMELINPETKLEQMAIELLKAIASAKNNLSESKKSWKKVLKYIGIKNAKIDVKPSGTSRKIEISSSLEEEQRVIDSFEQEILGIIKGCTKQKETSKELLQKIKECLEKVKNTKEQEF